VLDEVQEVRMHRRLAAREVDQVQLAPVILHQVPEDLVEVLERYVERPLGLW
jgi:hypothetical protein